MSELAQKNCVPCQGGVPPLGTAQKQALLAELEGWELVENHHLSKTFEFKNFAEALSWVNAVGAVAEEQNHHPDIYLAWGRVQVNVWTHKIDDLVEADYILAAKIDRLRSA